MDDRAGKAVNDWLDEAEGFGLRRERLRADLEAGGTGFLAWLEAAYRLGAAQAAIPEARPAAVEDWVRERRADAESVRRFPDNTCPASRHLAMIADGLADEGRYPVLEEDPQHAAASMYGVLASLWKARDEIERLGRGRDAPSGEG